MVTVSARVVSGGRGSSLKCNTDADCETLPWLHGAAAIRTFCFDSRCYCKPLMPECSVVKPCKPAPYCDDGVPVCYLNTCVCQRHQGPAAQAQGATAQREDLQLQRIIHKKIFENYKKNYSLSQ
ncbi:UNVERIFIED_CONTAM: hypothetical protein Slati_0256200 [Sesamum latifolium]|uniref:Uncharacterized protein n=1 Tax=Sesamum latifolium TaxID=2727402 RepID=A0AAW2YD48_9LAMI